MIVDLDNKGISLLLALINQSAFQGKDLESVLELKQKLILANTKINEGEAK